MGDLEEDPRPGQPAKLDELGEAHLIFLACSKAPQGHDHWTLRLLASQVVELGLVPSMSHDGIRKRLKKQSQAVAEVVYALYTNLTSKCRAIIKVPPTSLWIVAMGGSFS